MTETETPLDELMVFNGIDGGQEGGDPGEVVPNTRQHLEGLNRSVRCKPEHEPPEEGSVQLLDPLGSPVDVGLNC